MRYGTSTKVIHKQDGVELVQDTRVVNFETVYEKVTYRESIKVKGDEQIMAHVLKLMDDKKRGKIKDWGIECFDDNGEITRIEKRWTIEA